MITAIIHNSQFKIHNYDYCHNSQFIIIRTKFSSVRHNYDYRCSESSKLKVQCSKDKSFSVIREIRSR